MLNITSHLFPMIQAYIHSVYLAFTGTLSYAKKVSNDIRVENHKSFIHSCILWL